MASQQNKLRTLIKISKYINSNLELEKLLNIILKTSLDLVESEESSLMLLDKNNDRLIFYSVSGSNESVLNQFSFPAGQGIAGEVIKTGKPIIINDAQNDPRHFNKIDQELNFITRNIIAVPMKKGNRIVGLIEVLNAKDRDKFDNSDLELLQYLADQSALAIINKELYQEVSEKVEELSALYELSLASAFAKTVEELFNKAINILNHIFKVVSCVIINNIGLKSKLYKSESYNINIDTKRLFLDQNFEELDSRLIKNVDYKNICSITIPLISRGEVIGVIGIGDLGRDDQFGELEMRLLSTIANQISDVCENIRLREEEVEKKRIEKEVDVMRDLQQGIIPKEFPDVKKMEITGYNLPAMEVGGDFYDIFKLSEDKVGFVIADVSGKGASSGLFMALSRSIVKVYAYNENSPSDVLYKSNNVIIEDSKNGMFVTLFYAVIDTKRKKLKFSNGGHNRQIFYKKKDRECRFLYVKGKPLGVIENSQYSEEEIDIDDGDILFLYTDGINEAVNIEFEEFGDTSLLSIIKDNSDKSVTELREIVIDRLKNFVGDAKQTDDITMFIIKYNGSQQNQHHKANEKTIKTNTQTHNVAYIVDETEKFLKKNSISEEIIEDIMIVIDEAVTNVMMYSYKDSYNKNNVIICKLKIEDNSIIIKIIDFGEYSPEVIKVMEKPKFDINGNKLGGFGLFIINNFMDEIDFKRNDKKPENVLIMKKYI